MFKEENEDTNTPFNILYRYILKVKISRWKKQSMTFNDFQISESDQINQSEDILGLKTYSKRSKTE